MSNRSNKKIDLAKFKPRNSVKILIDHERPTYFKIWALARLMAWMCLDQRAARRPSKGQASRRPFRTRNARMTGHLVLADILDSWFQPGRFDKTDDTLKGIFRLFLQSGSFRGFVESAHGGLSWLGRMKKSTERLRYVKKIVEYLCRCEASNINQDRFTIQITNIFIEQTEQKLKRSAIGKYWDKHKQAAPYIFAFYETYSSSIKDANSIRQFISGIEKVAKDKKQLSRLVGEAAYVANLLNEKVQRVRARDFEGVKPVTPKVNVFNSDEMRRIGSIDPRQSKDEGEDWRPKPVSFKKG